MSYQLGEAYKQGDIVRKKEEELVLILFRGLIIRKYVKHSFYV